MEKFTDNIHHTHTNVPCTEEHSIHTT